MNDVTLNYLGAILIVAFATYIMMRSRAKGFKEAINEIGGRAIVFYAALTFALTILPRTIVNSSDRLGDWNQVSVGVQGAKEEASQFWQNYGLPAAERDSDGIPLDPALMPTAILPEMETLEVEVTAVPSSTPTPDTDAGGGVPESAATSSPPTLTPSATAMPTIDTRKERIEELYSLLATAKMNGDRPGGNMVVGELERLSPDDIIGITANSELEVAERLVQRRNELASLTGGSLQPTQEGKNLFYAALGGGQFAVISDGAKTFSSMCSEMAQVRDITQGWTFGDTFEVPRCYLVAYGATQTGDTFSLGGQ